MLDYRSVITEGAQLTKSLCSTSHCTNIRLKFEIYCHDCLVRRGHFRELRKKAPAKARSHVYFIKSGEYIKIGVTTALKKRVEVLQTANPEKLEVLATVEGGERDEKFVHSIFKNHHVRGEWFSPHDEIYNYIKCLENGLDVYKTCELAFTE